MSCCFMPMFLFLFLVNEEGFSWHGSQRQLQSHPNDNYTYRLTTIIPAICLGVVLLSVHGA